MFKKIKNLFKTKRLLSNRDSQSELKEKINNDELWNVIKGYKSLSKDTLTNYHIRRVRGYLLMIDFDENSLQKFENNRNIIELTKHFCGLLLRLKKPEDINEILKIRRMLQNVI